MFVETSYGRTITAAVYVAGEGMPTDDVEWGFKDCLKCHLHRYLSFVWEWALLHAE